MYKLTADINECTVVSDLCGNNGMCIDTNGNYTCGCEEGHIRDGQHCRSKYWYGSQLRMCKFSNIILQEVKSFKLPHM